MVATLVSTKYKTLDNIFNSLHPNSFFSETCRKYSRKFIWMFFIQVFRGSKRELANLFRPQKIISKIIPKIIPRKNSCRKKFAQQKSLSVQNSFRPTPNFMPSIHPSIRCTFAEPSFLTLSSLSAFATELFPLAFHWHFPVNFRRGRVNHAVFGMT